MPNRLMRVGMLMTSWEWPEGAPREDAVSAIREDLSWNGNQLSVYLIESETEEGLAELASRVHVEHKVSLRDPKPNRGDLGGSKDIDLAEFLEESGWSLVREEGTTEFVFANLAHVCLEAPDEASKSRLEDWIYKNARRADVTITYGSKAIVDFINRHRQDEEWKAFLERKPRWRKAADKFRLGPSPPE